MVIHGHENSWHTMKRLTVWSAWEVDAKKEKYINCGREKRVRENERERERGRERQRGRENEQTCSGPFLLYFDCLESWVPGWWVFRSQVFTNILYEWIRVIPLSLVYFAAQWKINVRVYELSVRCTIELLD